MARCSAHISRFPLSVSSFLGHCAYTTFFSDTNTGANVPPLRETPTNYCNRCTWNSLFANSNIFLDMKFSTISCYIEIQIVIFFWLFNDGNENIHCLKLWSINDVLFGNKYRSLERFLVTEFSSRKTIEVCTPFGTIFAYRYRKYLLKSSNYSAVVYHVRNYCFSLWMISLFF